MNICGPAPNLSEVFSPKLTDKSADLSHYHGPSFAESIYQIARAAGIYVADGSSAANLSLRRDKSEKLDKLFSFTESEEEMLEDSLARIMQVLGELGR